MERMAENYFLKPETIPSVIAITRTRIIKFLEGFHWPIFKRKLMPGIPCCLILQVIPSLVTVMMEPRSISVIPGTIIQPILIPCSGVEVIQEWNFYQSVLCILPRG